MPSFGKVEVNDNRCRAHLPGTPKNPSGTFPGVPGSIQPGTLGNVPAIFST